jgi:hypothetical protein
MLHISSMFISHGRTYHYKVCFMLGALFSSRCRCAARMRLCRLLIEVASCFFRLFFPAFASSVIPVRRLASWPL